MDDYIDLSEAAQILDLESAEIYLLVRTGEIPAIRRRPARIRDVIAPFYARGRPSVAMLSHCTTRSASLIQ